MLILASLLEPCLNLIQQQGVLVSTAKDRGHYLKNKNLLASVVCVCVCVYVCVCVCVCVCV